VGNRSAIRALRLRPVPTWWRDAKLGIFVHWTPASVPAFAPTASEIGELFASGRPDALASVPYSEWYENSLRFPESPVSAYHREHYGDRPYRAFAEDWEHALDQWDPRAWAERFAATGARYVVLVTKHMDGYCLWPSDVPNPRAPRARSSRDAVGELAGAVRAAGMKFGVYYSGGLDSTFNDHPLGTLADTLAAQPRGDYVGYAEAQVRELIERYEPSVLWNDISWPTSVGRLAKLLEFYYDVVPDGVINDRFVPWSVLWPVLRSRPGRRAIDALVRSSTRRGRGFVPPAPPLYGVRTPEYAVFDDIQAKSWECVRGFDKSFGHNQASTDDDFLSRRDLLWMLCDISAKNGNLLINVGPRGEDAQLPERQLDRLGWLGEFLNVAGDALYGTRPWVTPGAVIDGDAEVRYTARDRDVFVFVRPARADGKVEAVTLTELALGAAGSVDRLDGGQALASATAEGTRLQLDPPAGPDVPAVIRLTEARSVRA
jgi:alpha-L-fucosidase